MTPFGKALRHLRLDRNMSMAPMAAALSVSQGYLSQIEGGSRAIPDDFPDRIADFLALDAVGRTDIRVKAWASQTEFAIRLPDETSTSDRILAGAIAHGFLQLSQKEKAAIAAFLPDVPPLVD